MLSYGACAIAMVLAIPATLFGAIAKATNWENTEYGHTPEGKDASIVLPLVLQNLTPPVSEARGFVIIKNFSCARGPLYVTEIFTYHEIFECSLDTVNYDISKKNHSQENVYLRKALYYFGGLCNQKYFL